MITFDQIDQFESNLSDNRLIKTGEVCGYAQALVHLSEQYRLAGDYDEASRIQDLISGLCEHFVEAA